MLEGSYTMNRQITVSFEDDSSDDAFPSQTSLDLSRIINQIAPYMVDNVEVHLDMWLVSEQS